MSERIRKVHKLLSSDVPSRKPLSVRELRGKLWEYLIVCKRDNKNRR